MIAFGAEALNQHCFRPFAGQIHDFELNTYTSKYLRHELVRGALAIRLGDSRQVGRRHEENLLAGGNRPGGRKRQNNGGNCP